MAKIIKYQFMKERTIEIPMTVPRLDVDGNSVLDENGKPVMTVEIQEEVRRSFTDCALYCPTESAYEANLPIAQREAYNGEYTVEGEFDPEPEYEPTTDDILNTLLGVRVR